jgi:hypothetical protein
VPDENGLFAGSCDGGDLTAATGAEAREEGMQGPCLGGGPVARLVARFTNKTAKSPPVRVAMSIMPVTNAIECRLREIGRRTRPTGHPPGRDLHGTKLFAVFPQQNRDQGLTTPSPRHTTPDLTIQQGSVVRLARTC